MTAELDRAVLKACAYLAAVQSSEGSWLEFDLPVGTSNEWMTAYVGLALTAVGRLTRCVERAATWLRTQRSYAVGWGYNAVTGPDADSTAHAVMLLRGRDLRLEQDVEWLLGLRRGHGFATFPRNDAWGLPHPCVTPLVLEALGLTRPEAQALARAHLRATQREDGTFPAYWWRNHHYSTFHNLRLAAKVGMPLPDALPLPKDQGDRGVSSCFDLAFYVGSMHLVEGHTATTGQLIALLLSKQLPDGTWPSAPMLRVTDPECKAPWVVPCGALFGDRRRIFTTASVLRVLGEVQRANAEAAA